jgi:hypothetical protein
MKRKMRFHLVTVLLLATTTLTASVQIGDQPNALSTSVGGDEHYWGYLTQENAGGYALDTTTKSGWTFVEPYKFSGPNNWEPKSIDEAHHKRAVYTISGANLADVFSAKIYGKITQGGEEPAPIPDWSLEGKAEGDFRIEPDEVFMWIEDAKRYKSFEGTRTVDSKWKIKSLYGSAKDISLATAQKIITVGPDLDFDSMELGPGKFIVEAVKDGSTQYDNAELEIFKFDIKHNGNIVTDQTVDVSVSQRNQLEFDIQPADVKGMVSAYKWTVPGTNNDRVANYVPEKNKTTITKLESENLAKPSVKYHWVTKSSNAREVKGEVTIDGKQYRKTASFNVTAPDSSFSSQTTNVIVYDYGTPIMRYGDYIGIKFSASVEGAGGKKIFQRVDKSNTRRQRDTGEWERRYFKLYCDGDLEKELDYYDSPYEKLFRSFGGYYYQRYTRTDDFTTWLMFKHPDQGIWVPLREIKWWWAGTASYNKPLFKWELIRGDNNENPTSVESKKLPEWNGNTQNQPPYELID